MTTTGGPVNFASSGFQGIILDQKPDDHAGIDKRLSHFP
jgi:hypothetical protein